MANSSRKTPLNPPAGQCKVPPRTPGMLGFMDQGDPSQSSLLGDSPGVLGVNDWASPDIRAFFGLENRTQGGELLAPAINAAPASTANLITTDLLSAADESNEDEYYDALVPILNKYAAAYGINTPQRVAQFLAQIGHESGFRAAVESGNMSAKRMREVFGCKGGMKNYVQATDDCSLGRLREKLWTEEGKYAGQPENLLNYVYAGRNGNGDEASGDGYKYRGRGLIQLTFKDNYRQFTNTHNARNADDKRDFVANPDLVASELKYAVESAFFFWETHKLNKLADTGDVEAVTKGVNGGLNGLPDRKSRLDAVKKVLNIK